MYFFIESETLSRAEPPAGPPKFGFGFAGVTFPKISLIFEIIEKRKLSDKNSSESTQKRVANHKN